MTNMWNYRIVKTYDEEIGEDWFEISEVYYDQLGKPMGHCKATVGGDTSEEIKTVLEMMSSALEKPVMKTADFKS
jgi:hypothetical protein